jgi:hypothetical protein
MRFGSRWLYLDLPALLQRKSEIAERKKTARIAAGRM